LAAGHTSLPRHFKSPKEKFPIRQTDPLPNNKHKATANWQIPKFPNVTKPQTNKKHRHIKIPPVQKIIPKLHKNLTYANNKNFQIGKFPNFQI
jgi:hypothetical protein